MNKSLKGTAIVAAAMVTVGILLTAIGWMAGGNQPVYLDRKGIHVGSRGGGASGGELVSFSQDVDSFSNIRVDLDYYDVDLVPGDRFSVEGAYLSEAGEPVIRVENDTLVVKDKRDQLLSIDLDFPGLIFDDKDQPNITIYYPQETKLKDVAIDCDSSNLDLEDVTAETAEFELDFGSLDLSGITVNRLEVTMDSGNCTLEKIKAADKLTISNDMGKTTLSGAETKSLEIEADSGEVVLNDVKFDHGDFAIDLGKTQAKGIQSNGLKVEANSGEVVIEGELRGVTDISSDMGAVTVSPGAPRDQFNYELNADMGSITLGGEKMNGSVSSSNAGAENTLKITTDMGAIKVDFE